MLYSYQLKQTKHGLLYLIYYDLRILAQFFHYILFIIIIIVIYSWTLYYDCFKITFTLQSWWQFFPFT
jgi:hypothetical protein